MDYSTGNVIDPSTLLVMQDVSGWIVSNTTPTPSYPIIESLTMTVVGTSTTNLEFDMPAVRPDGDLYILAISKDDDQSVSFGDWTALGSVSDPDPTGYLRHNIFADPTIILS